MSQIYNWPSESLALGAQGDVGQPAPSVALEVAGVDPSGDLRALSVSTGGVLNVNIGGGIANPLPVEDVAAEASLASIDGKLPAALGIQLASGSLSIVLASDAVIPLPTGSATLAEQQAQTALLTSMDANIIHVDTDDVTVVASALPTGAAEEATLSAMSAKLPAALGQTNMAGSLSVAIASNQSAVPVTVASVPLPSGAATEATLLAFSAKTAAALVPNAYDEIGITYVSGGPADGQIDTVTYELATVLVATLTMGYDGSGRLNSVVKS